MASYLTLVEQLSEAVDQLNEVLQGDENTTVTINGQQQPSVQKKTLDEVNAKIQLVLDAAADIDAVKYATTEDGIAATDNGQFFSVVSDKSDVYLELYKNSSGFAELIKEYPTTLPYIKNIEAIKKINRTRAEYLGQDEIIPIYVDSEMKILLGIHKGTGELFAEGLLNPLEVSKIFNEEKGYNRQASYIGNDIYPIITDSQFKVLLGINSITGEIIGIPSSNSQPTVPTYRNQLPLNYSVAKGGVNHLAIYGQSNSVGGDGSPPISIEQPNENVTFYNGPNGRNGGGIIDLNGTRSLVETEVETPCSGAANYTSLLLSSDGITPAEHVIFCSTAGVGSMSIDELSKDNASQIFSNALNYVQSAYSQSSGTVVPCMPFIQGERDANTAATESVDYLNRIIKLQADFESGCKAITLQSEAIPMLLIQINFNSRTRDDVARAQFAASNNSDKIFIVGVSYRLPYFNHVHFGNVGSKLAGCYIGRAYKQLLDGVTPDCLKAISAYATRRNINIKFNVPCSPMVFDIKTINAVTDYGFKITDSEGDVQINSINISGDNVIILLNRDLIGDAFIRYALDYSQGRNVTGEGAGNLRDSAPETVNIHGEDYNLFNFSPSFELPIIKTGI